MNLFRRSIRWRQAVVLACLPYLLVSVFVDFVHVHSQTSAPVHASAAITAPAQPPQRADYSCTACLWLRTGQQLTSQTTTGLAAESATSDLVLPARNVWPDSPTSRPSLLRGPPSSLLG